MAQVVYADVEVDPGRSYGWQPGPDVEGVPRDGGSLAGAERQIRWAELPACDPVGELIDLVGGECHGAGLVVLGVGLGEHPLTGWDFLIETSTTASSTVTP